MDHLTDPGGGVSFSDFKGILWLVNGDGAFPESDAWRLIAEHSRDLVLLLDLSGRILYASPSHLPILGLDPASLVGVPASEHIHPDDREVQREAFRKRLETGHSEGVDIRVRKADGDFLLVESLGAPIRNERGDVESIVISARDISARHEAERKLRRSQERYRVIFERNLAGVYRSTVDGRLLECNPAFAKMLGFDSVEEVLQIPTWDLYFSRSDREVLIEKLTERREMHNFEICLRKKDGSPVWVLQNDAMVYDTDDGTPYMEGTIVDITARKNAEERIEHQAYHDHLTDLPNRLLFHDRLSLAVANARAQGDRLTVMFLDLDHFKLINDTMAHSAGDELLRRVAVTLQSHLRSEDTVSRMGGDEFTILLPHVKDENEAAKVAQSILDALTVPVYIHGREVFVSGSIGISMFPSDGDEPETLIKNADSAMYRAKDAGRNNFQFHTPMAQHRAEARLTMETSLRHALEREEFYLEYQPQVSLETGAIVGVEALIRWQHPDKGVVAPLEFIGIAEEIGLILPIGEWVLSTACRQLAQWNKAGAPPLRLSVNLSPRQFQSSSLIEYIAKIIEESCLTPGILDLEITESLAMRDTELTIGILRKIKELGVSASIDDFGTGYSSLSSLKTLPIGRLKIDELFVREIATNPIDEAIVDAIIKMAHSMGLSVIAEGVEEQAQRDVLGRLGCDEMQGFLFSRPAGPEKVLEMLLRSD